MHQLGLPASQDIGAAPACCCLLPRVSRCGGGSDAAGALIALPPYLSSFCVACALPLQAAMSWAALNAQLQALLPRFADVPDPDAACGLVSDAIRLGRALAGLQGNIEPSAAEAQALRRWVQLAAA